MAHKLRIPAARCPVCGHVTRDFELIDRRCERTVAGARCRGVNTGALSYDDWQACGSCQGTGRHEPGRCRQCLGEGWLYVGRTAG